MPRSKGLKYFVVNSQGEKTEKKRLTVPYHQGRAPVKRRLALGTKKWVILRPVSEGLAKRDVWAFSDNNLRR